MQYADLYSFFETHKQYLRSMTYSKGHALHGTEKIVISNEMSVIRIENYLFQSGIHYIKKNAVESQVVINL